MRGVMYGTVRVVQRHSDRLAAILERKDLLDARQLRQRGGAVGPGFDHGARPGDALGAERAGALGGEADDFAAADARARAP